MRLPLAGRHLFIHADVDSLPWLLAADAYFSCSGARDGGVDLAVTCGLPVVHANASNRDAASGVEALLAVLAEDGCPDAGE
ncbi:hypothetical protein [Thauera sp. SDU_THAU2]|uniref:hypothetical protein n=1 Tax=Thauera sp. SDU_THAU2 TaxID=3136633 RepID=UPI0031204567